MMQSISGSVPPPPSSPRSSSPDGQTSSKPAATSHTASTDASTSSPNHSKRSNIKLTEPWMLDRLLERRNTHFDHALHRAVPGAFSGIHH